MTVEQEWDEHGCDGPYDIIEKVLRERGSMTAQDAIDLTGDSHVIIKAALNLIVSRGDAERRKRADGTLLWRWTGEGSRRGPI